MNEPRVQVGILSRERIDFVLHGSYHADTIPVSGRQTDIREPGRIRGGGAPCRPYSTPFLLDAKRNGVEPQRKAAGG